jgi:hypothetical protein
LTAEPKRIRKTIKLPNILCRGIVLSSKYGSQVRGIVKSTKKTLGPSMSIDINDGIKNINVRIYSGRLNITGCKTEAQVSDVFSLVQDKINEITDDFNYMKENMKAVENAIQFLLETLRYNYSAITYNIVGSDGNIVSDIVEYDSVNYANITSINHKITMNVPENIDKRIVERLIVRIYDFPKYSTFIEHLFKVISLSVCPPILTVNNIKTIIVNVAFNIGFPINKNAFREVFNERDGFKCMYDSTCHRGPIVSMPITKDDGSFIRKAEKCNYYFIVKKLGSVTLTGPHYDMEDVFNSFMKIVDEMRHVIESTE